MPYGVPMSWMVSYFAHPPIWIDEGHGAHFTCADGVRFLDTNVGDKSAFCGIDPEPVVRAVQQRVAKGSQFMLPTEDAIVVADELARRWGLPAWQFTLIPRAAESCQPLATQLYVSAQTALPRSAARARPAPLGPGRTQLDQPYQPLGPHGV